MQLIVIAGFLGSGKTTLLREMARDAVARGQRIAIVENEVGQVGIDDLALADLGLPVREIYSGCVCCSLRLDLITTLLALERDVAPETVFLEPSGAASPRLVMNALLGYGGTLEPRRVVTLIDASRYGRLKNLSLPIIQDGITTADLLVYTKSDLVSAPELAEVRRRIEALRPGVPGIETSLCRPESFRPVAAWLAAAPVPTAGLALPPAAAAPVPNDPDGPRPTACAREIRLAGPLPAETVRQATLALVRGLQSDLAAYAQEGPLLIGHLKAAIHAPGQGFWMASATTLDDPPTGKGGLGDQLAAASLRLNAIVYGLTPEALHRLADHHLTQHLSHLQSS